jgi:hypothetical protein
MTIHIHSDDDEKRADVHGIHWSHPMNVDYIDPLDVFTRIVAVLAAIFGVATLLAPFFRK